MSGKSRTQQHSNSKKSGKKAPNTCGFCGLSGHNMNNLARCIKQSNYHRNAAPYGDIEGLRQRIKSSPVLLGRASTLTSMKYCDKTILYQTKGHNGNTVAREINLSEWKETVDLKCVGLE